jgi:N-acetylmuramoyl-L-alanine amidase
MHDRPLRSQSAQRKTVLRGVLDENLRLREACRKPAPTQARRRRPDRRRLAVLMVVVLLLAGAVYPFGVARMDESVLAVLGAWRPLTSDVGPREAPGGESPVSSEGSATAAPADPALDEVPLTERLAELTAEATARPAALLDPESGAQAAWDTPAAAADPLAYAAPLTQGDVPLMELFGLSVRTIVLDAGHGGIDPGTRGPRGTLEKDITLDVTLRLKAKLEEKGDFDVHLVRDADVTVPLSRRVAIANALKPDLFLSVHVNYLPNVTANAIETYYFGPHQDGRALETAKRENQDSEYTLSDFESVLRHMQDTLKFQESRLLASAIQKTVFENVRRRGQRVLDIGIRTAPFVVLLGVEAPSVLAEISSLSSPHAEEDLLTEGFRDELATYLAQGIARYLQKRFPDGEEPHGKSRIAESQAERETEREAER